MIYKLTAIFLSLLFFGQVFAKKAPRNTFRLDDGTGSQHKQLSAKEIEKIQSKIRSLRADKSQNFLIKRINDFRIQRLEEQLD